MSDFQDDIKELKQDVKEIKSEQGQTNVQLTRYNTLLEEHIKRTAMVEDRLEPIEAHVNLLQRFIRIMGWLTATLLALYSALR